MVYQSLCCSSTSRLHSCSSGMENILRGRDAQISSQFYQSHVYDNAVKLLQEICRLSGQSDDRRHPLTRPVQLLIYSDGLTTRWRIPYYLNQLAWDSSDSSPFPRTSSCAQYASGFRLLYNIFVHLASSQSLSSRLRAVLFVFQWGRPD